MNTSRDERWAAVVRAGWVVACVMVLPGLAGCCGEEEGTKVDAESRYTSASMVCPSLAVVQRDFGATLGGTYGGATFLEYEIRGNSQGQPTVIPPNGSACAQEIANRIVAACRVCEQQGGNACLTLVGGIFSTPSATCSFCGDFVCTDGGETLASCPADCTCGNGLCEGIGAAPENPLNCPQDCGGTCGDRYCAEPLEACTCEGSDVPGCLECVQDCCVAVCGDGECDVARGEAEEGTPGYCETDCAAGSCGDGVCQATENSGTCPADCAGLIACGDGVCADPETCQNCPEDCALGRFSNQSVCFDNICHACELRTCAADCEGVDADCGDGVCDPGEHPVNCPEDCRWRDCGPQGCSTCGNGVCEPGETAMSCPQDCDAACPGTSTNAGGDVPVCVADERYCGRTIVQGQYGDVIYDCSAPSFSCPQRPGIEGCFASRCDYEDGTLEPFCNGACPNRYDQRNLDLFALCPPNFEPLCLGPQALATCAPDPTYAPDCELLRVVVCPGGCQDGRCQGAPAVVGLWPQPARAGDPVTLFGTNFGDVAGTVTFPMDVEGEVVAWADDRVTVTVPSNATSGDLVLTRPDDVGSTAVFTLAEGPTVHAVVPGGGSPGDTVVIRGVYFGETMGTVTFTGSGAQATVTTWTDTELQVVVPPNATTGPIFVSVPPSGQAQSPTFYVDALPILVTDFSPKAGLPGDTVTIVGRNFPADVYVAFGTGQGTPAVVQSRTFEQVVVTVPEGVSDAPIRIGRNRPDDLRTAETFYIKPTVAAATSCGTSEAMAGDMVNVVGFSMMGARFVFGGDVEGRLYYNTGINAVVFVPPGAQTGPVRVVRDGIGEASTPPLTILSGVDTTQARWPMPDSMTSRCVDGSQTVPCASLAPDAPYYGQDGHTTAHSPSFTSAGAGLVTDTVTGLTWQARTESDGWEQAVCACRASTAGGQSDWRLPSAIEMTSILDFGAHAFQGVSGPWMEDDSAQFWVRDTFADDTNRVWSVTLDGPTQSERLGELHPVYFCVRGDSSVTGERYAVDEQVVTDQYTGLSWERRHVADTMAWPQALAYCQGLTKGGRSNWRLPSVKELLTLVDRTRSRSAIADVFPAEGFPRGAHWTSTPWYGGSSQSIVVGFDQGDVMPSVGQSARVLVLCVSD